MSCERVFQAIRDCYYHVCKCFLFLTLCPKRAILYLYTGEDRSKLKGGGPMGRVSCPTALDASDKALKAFKSSEKLCVLFQPSFWFAAAASVFFTADSCTARYFYVRWKKQAYILVTWLETCEDLRKSANLNWCCTNDNIQHQSYKITGKNGHFNKLDIKLCFKKANKFSFCQNIGYF